MVNHWNELDEETIEMLNGHCVMNALASQKSEITTDDLIEQFTTSTGQPHDLVKCELKRILYNGVIGGFIVRSGNKYSLPSLDNIYEADCDEGESKDVKPSVMEVHILTPGSPGITVKVKPGTAVSVVPYETSSGPRTSSGALGSTRESRKRPSTGSSSHCSPKKVKLDIANELADLVAKLKARPKLRPTDRSFASITPRLLKVDEDESISTFPRRRTFVPEPFGGEDEDEAESAGVAEDEVVEPPRRRSTRVRVPAKGKCGSLSCPSECKC